MNKEDNKTVKTNLRRIKANNRNHLRKYSKQAILFYSCYCVLNKNDNNEWI